jgi:uncharacterized membrane protein YfhO
MKKTLTIFIALVLMTVQILAQGTSITVDTAAQTTKGNAAPKSSGLSISNFDYEFFAAFGVIFLGVVVMVILISLFAKKVEKLEPNELMRIILLPIIIFASLFLIAAGWNSNQTAPAFGLLGAIAGYLFGQSSSKTG